MYLKIRSIVKEGLFILCALMVLLSLVNLLLSVIPKSRTPIDVSLNAIKIVSEGEIVGTVPITVKGHYVEYFFKGDKLDVDISSFDGLTDFKPASIGHNPTPGEVSEIPDSYYARKHTTYYADYNGRPILVSISFTDDYKNWLFTAYGYDAFLRSNQDYGHYAASTNGEISLNYFQEVFDPVNFFRVWENPITAE